MWGSSPLYAQVGSRSLAAAAATITTSASENQVISNGSLLFVLIL